MTISRVNAAGWGVGDKLTSNQANNVDINATNALDKRGGQTDTLSSVISFAGGGRLVPTVVIGADANSSYQVDGGNNVIRVTSAVTAARLYTLIAASAVAGDTLTIYCEASFLFEISVYDQALATLVILGNKPSSDSAWATFIYFGGWRLFQSGQGSRIQPTTFLAGGSVVVPRGVTRVIAVGVGAGGGGGAGYQITSVPNRYLSGGGGGGGAMLSLQVLTVAPTVTLTAVINAGGVGGTTAGQSGGDGGATTLTDGTTTWTWQGGGGGLGGYYVDGIGNSVYSPGGPSIAGWSVSNTYQTSGAIPPVLEVGPQHGGVGSSGTAKPGGPSPQGKAGGAAGATGVSAAGYAGGGGGGGGGGGPFGVGDVGGSGTNGQSVGFGGAGGGGSGLAAANSGAGGGGGASAAMGSGGTGAFGTGANGGSGQITLFWIK